MPQYEMNLRDYWRIIKKRKSVIVLVFLFVSLLTYWLSGQAIPMYRASAEVKILQRATFTTWFQSVFIASGDPLATEAQVIRSGRVLGEVAKALGLVDEDASEDEVETAAARLQGQVATSQIEATNIIRITVSDRNAERAARIANEVAVVYRSVNFKDKRADAVQLMETIEAKLKDNRMALEQADSDLQEFRVQHPTAGTTAERLKRKMELERRLSELSKRYKDKYPGIIAVKQQIARVDKELSEAPLEELVMGRLERRRESLILQQQKLLEGYDVAVIGVEKETHDVVIHNRARIPGQAQGTKQSVQWTMGALAGIVLGFMAALVWEHLDTSIGTIEDVEEFLKVPVVGVVPYMDSEMERAARIHWRKKKMSRDERRKVEQSRLVLHFGSSSPTAEAYRTLRTNLQYAGFDTGGKKLLLTSAGPGEGKSLTATNLSITYAQSGRRVLLISGDMRRPSIHRYFGLQRAPGLSDAVIGAVPWRSAVRTLTDVLMGDTEWDDLLKVPGLDNLNILTSGYLPPNPGELLGSADMERLMGELSENFDVLILDSPPVLPVADAPVLAPKVDGILLIYQAGRIARNALLRSKVQLQNVGGSVKGIVLNHVKPQMESGDTYYYRYRYYGKGAR